MNGAKDVVIDHDMIVTKILRRLSERLDGPRIAAELNLRINHPSLHCPLLLWSVMSCARNPPPGPSPGAPT